MVESKLEREQEILLSELAALSKSEKLKRGNIQVLRTLYLQMNLSYIMLCEHHTSLPYMPSSKYDVLFNRYIESGDREKVKEVVESRLKDIVKYVKRV